MGSEHQSEQEGFSVRPFTGEPQLVGILTHEMAVFFFSLVTDLLLLALIKHLGQIPSS